MFEPRTPFSAERIRAAAIYCSDGRWGEQVDEFLHAGLSLPRYDRVAIPGGAACLAGHLALWHQEAALVEHIEFLLDLHGLARVVLIAHQECALYTVRMRLTGDDCERQQRRDLEDAAHRLERLHPALAVETWFARRSGLRVRFEPICAAGA